MRRPGLPKALAIAVLTAGLSFAGPGARALASDAGRMARNVADGEGQQAPPFVARHEAAPVRVALQPSRRGTDDTDGRRPLFAALMGAAPALDAPSGLFFDVGRPPLRAPSRHLGFVRTSRGPPLG